MIKIEGGVGMQVKGNKIDIMAEVSQMLDNLVTNHILDKKDVEECVRIAFMSREEVRKESDKKLEELLRQLLED